MFLVVGITTLNFLVSAVLINYRRAKEELSGEKDLTPIEKEWLSLKTYIHSLEPRRKEQLPDNCLRRTLFQLCTHWAYKIFQVVMLAVFLTLAALYRTVIDADSEGLFWRIAGLFITLALFDYAAELIAFGYQSQWRKRFIFDTSVCLFILIGYCLKQSDGICQDRSE